jgi:hypothetical protein
LALAIAILSGCGLYSAAPGAVAPLAAAEGLTVIGTDKTIGDHIVSYQRGKNCSTIRVQTGRTYCEEDERVGLEEIYCYRTLGQINCYQKPMPYGDKYQAVGHTPPVPPKP